MWALGPGKLRFQVPWGGGRGHAEGAHRTDAVINCWPYFLRAPEAGCFCTRPLARARALPPRSRQALLCGRAGRVFCSAAPRAAQREGFKLLGICSHPTSSVLQGPGAGDGGRLWSGSPPRAHLCPRSHRGEGRGGEETGWERPLLGLGRPVDQSFPHLGPGFSLLPDRTDHLWVLTLSSGVVDQQGLRD